MNKLLKLLLYLVMFSILVGPLTSVPLQIPAVNVYFSDIVVFLLSLVCLVRINRFIDVVRKDKILRFFYAFAMVSFISLIISPLSLSFEEKAISFLYLVRLVSYSSIYLVINSLLRTREIKPMRLNYWLLTIGFLLAVTGWLQYWLYPDLRNLYYLGWDPHYKRIFATMLDPNYLGLLLGLTLLLSFFRKQSGAKVWLFRLVIFVTLMFTYSRSSFAAFMGGSAYMAVVKKKYKLIGIVFILLVVSILVLPRPAGESVRLERLFSINERISSMKSGINIFSRYPWLGVGFNTIRYAKKDFKIAQDNLEMSHSGAGLDNSFIFVLATTGIIGLTAYILFLYQVYLAGSLTVKTSLLAILIHGLFVNSLFLPWLMIWLWVLVGMREDRGSR